MTIEWVRTRPQIDDTHVLVSAEEGFSPLSHYAKRAGIEKSTELAFVAEVERKLELGTLLPHAPISAIPASCIRLRNDAREVLSYVRDLRDAVRSGKVTQRNIAIDLASPTIAPHVRAALETFAQDLAADDADGVRWFIILGDGEEPP